MPTLETEIRVSTKKLLKSSAQNEIDFKMVDLGDEYGPNIIGRRVEVYWPDSRRWFRGRVKAFDHQKMIHKIDYDDGDKERLDLKNEVFRMEVYPGETVNVKPISNIKHKPKFPISKGTEAPKGDVAGLNSSCPPTAKEGDSELCPGLENKKAEIGVETRTNNSQSMSDIVNPKDMSTNKGKLEAEHRNLPIGDHFEHQVGKKQLLSSFGNKELPLDQLTCTNYYVRRKRATSSNSFKV